MKTTMNLKKLIKRVDLEFIMWFLSSSSVNNLFSLSKLSSIKTYYGNIWNVLEHSLAFMKIIFYLKRKELWKFYCCHSFWTLQILLDFHPIVCWVVVPLSEGAFAEWLANLLPLVEYNMWQIAACPYYICNDITVASILFFTSRQAHSDRCTSQSFLFPLEQVYFTEWYWNRAVNIFVWKLQKSRMIAICTK